MNIKNFFSDTKYDYYNVSRTDNRKKDEAEELKLKLGQQKDDDKKAQEKKSREQLEKEKRVKSEELKKKLEETYNGLSDRAKSYLETLKEKFGNMDIYVADTDSDEEAGRIMSRGTKQFSVLIDTQTLEAMAEDRRLAKQYEDMITESAEELNSLKEDMNNKGLSVKAVGVKIDDEGKSTYYSIIDDSLSYYEKELEKQQKKKEERAEQKKQEEKKEKLQEELEKKQETLDKKQDEIVKEILGSQYSLLTAGTIGELENRLQLESKKVQSLQKNGVFAGVGVDLSV